MTVLLGYIPDYFLILAAVIFVVVWGFTLYHYYRSETGYRFDMVVVSVTIAILPALSMLSVGLATQVDTAISILFWFFLMPCALISNWFWDQLDDTEFALA